MRIVRRIHAVLLSTSCAAVLLAFPLAARAVGPSGDVYLGFSRLGSSVDYPEAGGLNGWEGAVHLKLRRLFKVQSGVEGDVAQYGLGASSASPRNTTFMAGPRITVGVLGLKAYAHGLAGVEILGNSASIPISGNALILGAGGGVEMKIVPLFGWRVAGDYLIEPTSPEPGYRYRLSTGLVFKF
jgi:hypothetical protein